MSEASRLAGRGAYGFGILVALTAAFLLSGAESGVDYITACSHEGRLEGNDCRILDTVTFYFLIAGSFSSLAIACIAVSHIGAAGKAIPEGSLKVYATQGLWLMGIAVLFLCIGFYGHLQHVLYCSGRNGASKACQWIGLIKTLGTGGIAIMGTGATWLAKAVASIKEDIQ